MGWILLGAVHNIYVLALHVVRYLVQVRHDMRRQFVAALNHSILIHFLYVTMLAHELEASFEEDWRVARSWPQHILHLNVLAINRFLDWCLHFLSRLN